MASRWFCRVFGQEVGPLGFEDLVEMVRSGTLTDGDRVRGEFSEDWIPAREVTGLFPPVQGPAVGLNAPEPKPLPSPPEPKPGFPGVAAARPAARPGRRSGARTGPRVAIAVAIGVVAVAIVGYGFWSHRKSRASPESTIGHPMDGQTAEAIRGAGPALNRVLGCLPVQGVTESGFQFPEKDRSEPFRWTDGAAKLVVPLAANETPQRLWVNIQTIRPTATRIRLKILVDGSPLFEGPVRTGRWAANLDLSSRRFSGQTTIELQSDTFTPKSVMDGGKNPDTRALGTQLKGIMLQSDDAGQPPAEKNRMLRGRALDAQGQPAPGIVVAARPTGGPSERSLDISPFDRVPCLSLTNGRGEFCLGPLDAGDYEIRAYNIGDETLIDGRRPRPLPDAFPTQRVSLKPGSAPAIELRGVPSVTLSVQYYDAAGKAIGGFPLFLMGILGGSHYWTFEEQAASGQFALRAPKGLEAATLNAPYVEGTAFRYRVSKELPLALTGRLGAIASDVPAIGVVRYRIPVLVVRATTENGEPVQDFRPRIDYASAPTKAPATAKRRFPNGIQGDVGFHREPDDRWRTASFLLPDEPFTLTVEAAGYKPKSQQLTLPEGAVRELSVILEPR
jgi:hypothetical protein